MLKIQFNRYEIEKLVISEQTNNETIINHIIKYMKRYMKGKRYLSVVLSEALVPGSVVGQRPVVREV